MRRHRFFVYTVGAITSGSASCSCPTSTSRLLASWLHPDRRQPLWRGVPIDANSQVQIAGASVYCELCGELTHTWTTADANGFYIFSGDLANGGGVWLSGQPTPLLVAKDGYGDPAACPPGFSCREILINGDTRFDIELVRR